LSAQDRPLERALALSHELLAAADHADFQSLARLDAERLQLLTSFRTGRAQLDADEQATIAEISRLNAEALGLVEHHRRIKGRQLDMASVGRRAVAAYATTARRW
jgi:hypothetical protein